MTSSENDDIRKLAKEILREMNRQKYSGHRDRVRALKNLAEKAIYIHLLYNQPLSFTVLRGDLNIDKKTLSKYLKKFLALGFVVQNEYFQYVLTVPQP